MDLDKLMQGQRYLFHYKNKQYDGTTTFRATFDRVIYFKQYSTFRLTKFEPNDAMYPRTTAWYMDTHMVSKIETLNDVLLNKSSIPEDVLLEIDNYY